MKLTSEDQYEVTRLSIIDLIKRLEKGLNDIENIPENKPDMRRMSRNIHHLSIILENNFDTNSELEIASQISDRHK